MEKARKEGMEDKKANMVKIEGVERLYYLEPLLKRKKYGTTASHNRITYPWRNALQSPENLNGTVMFNLVHDKPNQKRRAARLGVRVRSTDGTITTPAPKDTETDATGSGELMTGGNKERFPNAVYSVMDRNIKKTRAKNVRKAPKERVRKETAKKQQKLWTHNCRPKQLKKKGVLYEACTYAQRRDDGEKVTIERCESENKNCLLASARKNLDPAVTKDEWMEVWTMLDGPARGPS